MKFSENNEESLDLLFDAAPEEVEEPEEVELEISLTSSVPVSSVVEQLAAELKADEMVTLIMWLDERAQDWYVTEELYKYFTQQHKIFTEEEENE